MASVTPAIVLSAGVKTDLNAEVTSVNVVTQEEIASFGGVPSDLEQLHQVEILTMYVAAYGYGRIHLEEIGFGFEDLGAFFYDPQRLIFVQSTFAVEVLLKVCEVRLATVSGREELIFGGWLKGRRLNICSGRSGQTRDACCRAEQMGDLPLQTRSCVLTWVPSSMVWSEKSISGTGFFSVMARARG